VHVVGVRFVYSTCTRPLCFFVANDPNPRCYAQHSGWTATCLGYAHGHSAARCVCPRTDRRQQVCRSILTYDGAVCRNKHATLARLPTCLMWLLHALLLASYSQTVYCITANRTKCLGPHHDFDDFTTYDLTTFTTSRYVSI